jgi:hypothetical protein
MKVHRNRERTEWNNQSCQECRRYEMFIASVSISISSAHLWAAEHFAPDGANHFIEPFVL